MLIINRFHNVKTDCSYYMVHTIKSNTLQNSSGIIDNEDCYLKYMNLHAKHHKIKLMFNVKNKSDLKGVML
jgi:hypothetical protein